MEPVGGLMDLMHTTGSGVVANDGWDADSPQREAEGGFPVRRPIVDYIIPLNVTAPTGVRNNINIEPKPAWKKFSVFCCPFD